MWNPICAWLGYHWYIGYGDEEGFLEGNWFKCSWCGKRDSGDIKF